MSEAVANIGRQLTVSLYIEDRKAGRDFSNMKNWSWSPTYYSGEDEYLGDGEVRPWQQGKGAEGSFSIEESDASFIHQIMQAISDAEIAGQRPKIVLVERTVSTSGGPLGKVTFPNVTLTMDTSQPSKGERKVRNFKFRSSVPRQE